MATWGRGRRRGPGIRPSSTSTFRCLQAQDRGHTAQDGAPRISGIEAQFLGGELWFGSMAGARKALDLRRDPRFALHSGSADPGEDPAAWQRRRQARRTGGRAHRTGGGRRRAAPARSRSGSARRIARVPCRHPRGRSHPGGRPARSPVDRDLEGWLGSSASKKSLIREVRAITPGLGTHPGRRLYIVDFYRRATP